MLPEWNAETGGCPLLPLVQRFQSGWCWSSLAKSNMSGGRYELKLALQNRAEVGRSRRKDRF